MQWLPKHFAFANGLINNKKCGLIIIDERQRSWNLVLNSRKTQVYIGDGWRKFIADNCLKEGDRINFEVVTNGETPIWKFHVVTDVETPMRKFQCKFSHLIIFICTSIFVLFMIVMFLLSSFRGYFKAVTDLTLKTSGVITPKSQIAASTSADAKPHFICTIKPYTIINSVLYLPMNYAKSNGLMDKREMILLDEKRRSWSVWLGPMGHHFGIKRGWAQFINANGVQVGDTYKFELSAFLL
ncbi:hypothetical protein RND71_004766 [Anisodus tanguticus]|uniref:TF-B3 domain-containing protein n=1 Tax=Anisodus tanguticus TaxID=243964 RepID=A0AAE1SQK3_9SOLA|nr:hypothetical protein RND71_004766 [Anisodus tanguticus]